MANIIVQKYGGTSVANPEKIKKSPKIAALTIIDEDMKEGFGFFHRITKALGTAGLNIEMINSASKAITVAVAESELTKAANALAIEFDLPES